MALALECQACCQPQRTLGVLALHPAGKRLFRRHARHGRLLRLDLHPLARRACRRRQVSNGGRAVAGHRRCSAGVRPSHLQRPIRPHLAARVRSQRQGGQRGCRRRRPAPQGPPWRLQRGGRAAAGATALMLGPYSGQALRQNLLCDGRTKGRSLTAAKQLLAMVGVRHPLPSRCLAPCSADRRRNAAALWRCPWGSRQAAPLPRAGSPSLPAAAAGVAPPPDLEPSGGAWATPPPASNSSRQVEQVHLSRPLS